MGVFDPFYLREDYSLDKALAKVEKICEGSYHEGANCMMYDGPLLFKIVTTAVHKDVRMYVLEHTNFDNDTLSKICREIGGSGLQINIDIFNECLRRMDVNDNYQKNLLGIMSKGNLYNGHKKNMCKAIGAHDYRPHTDKYEICSRCDTVREIKVKEPLCPRCQPETTCVCKSCRRSHHDFDEHCMCRKCGETVHDFEYTITSSSLCMKMCKDKDGPSLPPFEVMRHPDYCICYPCSLLDKKCKRCGIEIKGDIDDDYED